MVAFAPTTDHEGVHRCRHAHLLAKRRCTGGFIDICSYHRASAAAFSPCMGIVQPCCTVRRFNYLRMRCKDLDDDGVGVRVNNRIPNALKQHQELARRG